MCFFDHRYTGAPYFAAITALKVVSKIFYYFTYDIYMVAGFLFLFFHLPFTLLHALLWNPVEPAMEDCSVDARKRKRSVRHVIHPGRSGGVVYKQQFSQFLK